MLETPVLFLVFNRPDSTMQVFEKIRAKKPRALFIAADGPRAGNPDDLKKTKKVREVILQNIDWDCEVKTLFRDSNLGCGQAVSEGITWFFEHVEAGIILEDDTLPDLSFFDYCEELLDRYKDKPRIMHIAGVNLNLSQRNSYSYFFSIFPFAWGWASWRRAWQQYDYSLSKLEDFIQSERFRKYFPDADIGQQRMEALWKIKRKELDTWDYQWSFALWQEDGLSIVPNHNLVKNIGFGQDATHTTYIDGYLSNLSTKPVQALRHPLEIKVDIYKDYNEYFVRKNSYQPEIFSKLKRMLRWSAK